MKIKVQKPRGMNDILPQDQKYWQFISNIVDKRCLSFNFGKIETPVIESKDLFVRAIGEATDVIEKEMYEVKRSDNLQLDNEDVNSQLVLRPEYTASIVRAYIENGMQVWPQPVKLYSFGPLFRYDRPQKGRFREFWQFDLEVLGDNNPLADALLILTIWQIFQDLGLKDKITVEINSIGDKACRPKIKKKIVDYYRKFVNSNTVCEDCQRRFNVNPLRLLDCKNPKCQQIAAGAPQIIDNLCKDCKKHFTQVLEYLDDLSIPYDLNPKLIRGLDYYTRTTFEIRDINDKERQSSLGGGGRYDDLVENYGGKPTPAIGFAAGVERIVEKIKENEIKVPEEKGAEIYVIQIGDKAKKKALPLIASLGQKGLRVSCPFGKDSLKSQLRDANKMRTRFVLIIGQREALDNSIIIKDMVEANQETVSMDEIENFLINKLRNEP